MKRIVVEIDGLTGNECDEAYVEALMVGLLHPSVSVMSVIMEVRGDAYSGVGEPVEGRAIVRVTVDEDKNPVVKYLGSLHRK